MIVAHEIENELSNEIDNEYASTKLNNKPIHIDIKLYKKL